MYNPRDIAYKRLHHKTSSPIFCTNCVEYKHSYRECTKPITSLGVILYKKVESGYKYLLLCRRNTIGFVQLIRGKYSFSDINYIQQIINVLTNSELEQIKTLDFSILWELLWQDIKYNKENSKNLNDKKMAEDKFNKLKDGFCTNNMYYSIDYFINHKNRFYQEQEWGFPKGRRKKDEDDLAGAIRELMEETGISRESFTIDPESKIVEEYKSYDNIIYRNIYYLADYSSELVIAINETNMEQFTEISQIGFYGLNEINSKFRDYEISKRELVKQLEQRFTSL